MSFVPTSLIGGAFGFAADTLSSLVTFIPKGQIGPIQVAATLEEQHSSELQITEHPVETGAQITDHSFLRPIELTMKCAWSNASGDALSQAIGVVTSLVNSGGTQLFPDGSGPNSGYVNSIFSQLISLQANRTPFTVVTTLKSYPNMLIRGIRIPRDHTNSQALIATVSMRQVIMVSTVSTSALTDPTSLATPASTQGIANLGPVLPTPNATPSANASLPVPNTPSPLILLPGGPTG